MNCRKVCHLMSAYIDGELPGVEYRQVHLHLGQCEECRSEYDALLSTKRLLAQLRVKEPRPELPTLILQRVHAQGDPLHELSVLDRFRAFFQWLGEPRPFSRGLAVSAGVAVCGLLFVAHHVEPDEDRIVWSPADPALTKPLPQYVRFDKSPAPGAVRQVAEPLRFSYQGSRMVTQEPSRPWDATYAMPVSQMR